MNELYFKCDWKIKSVVGSTVQQVIGIAQDLNCDLYWLDVHNDPEGYFIGTFLMASPSTAALETFVAEAGAHMGLVKWYPADAPSHDRYSEYALWFANLSIFEILVSFLLEVMDYAVLNQTRDVFLSNLSLNRK